MIRRRINFIFLQETKWLRERAKKLDSWWFNLCYMEKNRSRNRLYIIVDKQWKRLIVDVKTVGYRIITLKIIVEQDILNVISAYTPHIKVLIWVFFEQEYWYELEGLCQDIQLEENIFLGGDLNGYVGSVSNGFDGLHWGIALGRLRHKVIPSWISCWFFILL